MVFKWILLILFGTSSAFSAENVTASLFLYDCNQGLQKTTAKQYSSEEVNQLFTGILNIDVSSTDLSVKEQLKSAPVARYWDEYIADTKYRPIHAKEDRLHFWTWFINVKYPQIETQERVLFFRDHLAKRYELSEDSIQNPYEYLKRLSHKHYLNLLKEYQLDENRTFDRDIEEIVELLNFKIRHASNSVHVKDSKGKNYFPIFSAQLLKDLRVAAGINTGEFQTDFTHASGHVFFDLKPYFKSVGKSPYGKNQIWMSEKNTIELSWVSVNLMHPNDLVIEGYATLSPEQFNQYQDPLSPYFVKSSAVRESLNSYQMHSIVDSNLDRWSEAFAFYQYIYKSLHKFDLTYDDFVKVYKLLLKTALQRLKTEDPKLFSITYRQIVQEPHLVSPYNFVLEKALKLVNKYYKFPRFWELKVPHSVPSGQLSVHQEN